MNETGPHVAPDAFYRLLRPVATSTFLERYFEREVLHVSRQDASYFRELYSVQCVEDALVLGADRPEHFALIKHDAPDISREAMTSERGVVRFRSARQAARRVMDPRSVVDAFSRGYTLNIKDAGAFRPQLAQLCNQIQAQLGFYVHPNVYFTPAGAQGFGQHYDTHDTLIVQIEGRKHWHIHDPVVALPLELQPYSERAHEGKLGPAREVCMMAGDSLYIPHGFPHAAVAADERSLHLTFAIAPLRIVDLLDALVQLAALGEPELRRALPPGWHQSPVLAEQLSERLTSMLPRALDAIRIPLAAEFAYNELFSATRTVAAGAFDTLTALERLGPHSRIKLRDDTPFELRDRGGRLDVVLAAKVITLPATARASFIRLMSGEATMEQIQQLSSDGSAIEFIRTLVAEQMISIE